MKRAIVWFKTDLRLHDNETLLKAIEWADEVIPFFCFDEKWNEITEYGSYKMGQHRKNFLIEAVQELEMSLQEKGSGLIVCSGNPKEEILKVAQQYGVTRVYAKKEVAHEELIQMEDLESSLLKIGISLEKYSTGTMYLATDLPFSIKTIPDIFTDFRKKVEKESTVHSPKFSPENINSPHMQSITWDKYHINYSSNKKSSFPFKGGENKAIQRLNDYINNKYIRSYKQTRDQLHGIDYSTKLAPWLAIGCISPRYIYDKIKKHEHEHGANESTYWVIFELLWRDFFRFSFKKHHHKFFLQSGIHNSSISDDHNPSAFQCWCNGETNNDLINAFMIELKETGFMSNRGRQIAASYLIYELKCDWRYGAAWFEEQLIDYDVCNNWGNWAYIAGVGNDPRGGRLFNIDKQTELYDKDGAFRTKWKK